MMHYQKGENIEEELTKDKLPFESLPTNFLWMHVKGGTKIFNVVKYAKNALDGGEHRTLVWSGFGGGVVKTISCAEILKQSYPLHQITRLVYKTVEERWEPRMKKLEEIIVSRQVPGIHILLTLDEVDSSTAGLQKAGTKTLFWKDDSDVQPSSSRNVRRDYSKQKRGKPNNQRNSNEQNKYRPQHNQRREKTKPEKTQEITKN